MLHAVLSLSVHVFQALVYTYTNYNKDKRVFKTLGILGVTYKTIFKGNSPK